jgi:hypothetical protein
MFTVENGKKALTMLVVVMAALALHQKFVAPKLAPKAKA